MPHRIVRAATLSERDRVAAAAFARAALERYYATLPPALAETLIGAAFLVEGDEVADAAVALDGTRPVGLVAGYPLAQMADRQRASLYHLLSALPREAVGDFVANARALTGEVPAIEDDGFYLARIGVAADARGSGLGDALLGHFLAEAGAADAVLHVHRDNARAHAFYRRHRFAVSDDSRTYWVMRRADS